MDEMLLPVHPEYTRQVRDAVRTHGFSEEAIKSIEVYETPMGRYKVRCIQCPAHEAKRLGDLLVAHHFITGWLVTRLSPSLGKYGVN